MTSGLIDRVSRHSRAMIESDFLLDQERDCPLLVGCYDLLARICAHLKRSPSSGDSTASSADTSETNISCATSEPSTAQAHLLSLLSSSEAAGVVGALYAAIALTSSVTVGSSAGTTGPGGGAAAQRGASSASPTPSSQAGPSSAVKSLAWRGLKLLRNIAELDLQRVQVYITEAHLPHMYQQDRRVRASAVYVA